MKTLDSKKGVTLTILAITVIIMVILASTIVINVGTAITDTRKATFSMDLKTIEDAVSIYYIQNNSMPSDKEALSKIEILNLSGNDNMNLLREEINLNGDEKDDTYFYIIDLSKLSIDNPSRGTYSLGDNDIYVVAYPSLKVYYLAGISADSTKYFSLSAKLTNLDSLKDIDNENKNSEITVKSAFGVIVKKQVRTWTNNANILIQTNMENNDKLYLSVAGREKRLVKTNIGINNLSFGSLEEIKNGKANISADITVSDIEYFNNLPQSEKMLYVIKEKDGEVIANIKVDLSNFENSSPSISNLNIKTNDNYNIFEFSVSDDVSGVDKVYYEYLKYYDEKADIKNFYVDINEYDMSYMKNKAKRVEISGNGTYQINVPKNIKKIQLSAVDKAGNTITVTKELEKDIYTTVLNKEIINKDINLQIVAYSEEEILNIDIALSTNGIDFEEVKSASIITAEEYKSIYNVSYESVPFTTQDIYVKIVLNLKNNAKYVRIINLKDINNIDSILNIEKQDDLS